MSASPASGLCHFKNLGLATPIPRIERNFAWSSRAATKGGKTDHGQDHVNVHVNVDVNVVVDGACHAKILSRRARIFGLICGSYGK